MLTKSQVSTIEKGLIELGLKQNEVMVYAAVLGSDGAGIPAIAKDSGLSRGTVYDLVEKLKQKGFLVETKNGKKRKIVIENPTAQLYSILERQHHEAKKKREAAESILAAVEEARRADSFKPQIRVYVGERGYRQVWDDIFSYEGREFVGIARMETFVKFAGEDFLDEIQERKVRLHFHSRAINESSDLARRVMTQDKKYNRETRLAPKEFVFPATEIIYGHKVAMFSTRKENIILVIESRDLALTRKAHFEMMWKFLEDKKL